MWSKVTRGVQVFLLACAVLFVAGFGLETSVGMPGYAVVFVDDTARTFLAPQCAGDWQRKPTRTFDLLRRTTASEAYRLHYNPDYDCVQTSAFAPDGRSVSGILLESMGLLPKKKYWWDMPYRTESGVVYPHG